MWGVSPWVEITKVYALDGGKRAEWAAFANARGCERNEWLRGYYLWRGRYQRMGRRWLDAARGVAAASRLLALATRPLGNTAITQLSHGRTRGIIAGGAQQARHRHSS